MDFLELFLEAAPSEAKQSYTAMALQHFTELLSPSRRSNTVSAKSATSMLKVSHVSQAHAVHQRRHDWTLQCRSLLQKAQF